MAPPLVIAAGTRLAIQYSTHRLRDTLEPFITDVSQRLTQSNTLHDSIQAAAESLPELAKFFVIDHDTDRSFALRDEYLFSQWAIRELVLCRSDRTRYDIDLTAGGDALIDLHRLLALSSSGSCDRLSIRDRLSGDMRDLLQSLMESGIIVEQERPLQRFAPVNRAGVYRLQHASLLYRTPASGVLVDPHLHSTYSPGLRNDIYRDQLHGKVDAILISHSHEDHWFLSTLLMFPLDTPIVVPKVPRPTIICGNMEELLRSCGFTNVIAVDWYAAPIRFGDIEVHVLPFYGEQPLRYEDPKHPDIRNWGNTYLIRSDQFTSWFLIDSGSDSLGSMADVARYVRNKFSHVDFMLSNLRPFHIASPLYINGGLNWLTLSPDQLRTFSDMKRHCITLGPSGVAEICDIVQASYYLPYAHWFGEVGCEGDVAVDTPGQSEVGLLKELADSLDELGVRTKIIPWRIGDGFVRQRGGGFEAMSLGE